MRYDNRDCRLVQSITAVSPDFNQFKKLKKQLFVAAETIDRDQVLSALLITSSKEVFEQLKRHHKNFENVGRQTKGFFWCYTAVKCKHVRSFFAEVQFLQRST